MIEETDVPDQRWRDMRDMLVNIVMKFADVLDATGLVPRDRMKHALVWLRDAEACARALVLSMALTVVLGPIRKVAARLRGKSTRTTRPLYRFRYSVERAPQRVGRVQVFRTLAYREYLARQRAEDSYNREMFGRRLARCWANRPATPACDNANDVILRKLHPPSARVSRERFCIRYNAVAMAVENPEPFARRMARRLARDRARTVRAALTRAPQDPRLSKSPFEDFTRAAIDAAHALAYPRRYDSG